LARAAMLILGFFDRKVTKGQKMEECGEGRKVDEGKVKRAPKIQGEVE